MSVGIVVVSHSPEVAEGTKKIAQQMAGSVRIEAAGGTDDGRIGTSFEKISRAVESANSGEGVAVLCDLGSAVMTAESVIEFADSESGRAVLVDAPLVEGAVAAAVAAENGVDVDAVVAAGEAARGQRKTTGEPSDASEKAPANAAASADEADSQAAERTVRLRNKSGLHARPAAEFVKRAATFDAAVRVNGKDAKSLLGIMALGLTQGTEMTISATGPQANEAVESLADMVEGGFGEIPGEN